jgi:hypothetical protein
MDGEVGEIPQFCGDQCGVGVGGAVEGLAEFLEEVDSQATAAISVEVLVVLRVPMRCWRVLSSGWSVMAMMRPGGCGG